MLGDNRGTALHNHILALERLQEAKDEASADFNERKKLAKEDGFDTNVVAAILKRRKAGEGMTQAFDDLLQEYEFAIAEQKKLPLERELTSVRTSVLNEFAEVDGGEALANDDDIYAAALALVIEHRKASASWLQRQMKVGYNSAARLIERMQEGGYVSAPDHTGKRDVLTQVTYPASDTAN